MTIDLAHRARTRGLIFDGPNGTMLMKAGLEPGRAGESWNLEHPDQVLAIHRAYTDAGVDVITTNTFGGSPLKLAKAGLGDRVEAVNRAAAHLAREAAGDDLLVAGNIGSVGELVAPNGTLSEAAAIDCYARQARLLAEGGVDFFLIQTIFDLNEGRAAIRGIQAVCDLPICATMTFQQIPNGFATMMGHRVADGMQALLDWGAVAVGANCSLGSDTMLDLAAEVRRATHAPVIVQPNAGVPENRRGRTVFPESAEFFAANLLQIRALGVEIVGGCCGATPEAMRLVVERVRG